VGAERRRSWVARIVVPALFFAAALLPGGSGDENQGVKDRWHQRQLVIRLASDLEAGEERLLSRRTAAVLGSDDLDRLAESFGLRAARGAGGDHRLFLLTFAEGAPSPPALAAAYRASGLVALADPNLRFQGFAAPPDDPFYGSSGTWKQPYADLWGLEAIEAAAAWAMSGDDSPVVIGLVDSGLDHGHPDLGNGRWRNAGEIPGNGLDDDGNGYVDDIWGWDFTIPDEAEGSGVPLDLHGHGTNGYGIISAGFDNGIGIPGLAFNCRTMVVKGLDDQGEGSLFDLTRAMAYAVDNGARVLCLGWGAAGQSEILHQAVREADEAGTVIVCAAGNSGLPVSGIIPAGYPETVAVGASQQDGTVYELSNGGPGLDIVAPGIDILTTRAAYSDPSGSGERFVGDDYFRADGTSVAAPHAAGAAGLLLARDAGLDPDQVRTALRATALPLEDGRVVSEAGGYGLLQAGALLAIEDPVGLRLSSPAPGSVLFGNFPLEAEGRITSSGPALWRLSWGAGDFPRTFTTFAEAKSPAQGAFSVSASFPTSGLNPGRYTIRLQAWHPSRLPVYEERVTLVIDNSRGLLSGRVTSAGTGLPLAAVEMTAFKATTLETAGVAFTSSSGSYSFTGGLPAGPYYIRGGSGFTDVIPQYYDGVSSIAGATAVDVAAGQETEGIDFALSRRGSISGTVTDRGSGVPVAGALVSIYYPAGTLMRSTMTGSNGEYRFTNLLEQHWFIGAAHPDGRFVPRYYQDAATIDGATPVHVADDTETAGIDLALKRHGGSIRGTVRSSAGALPIAGVTVEAVALDGTFRRTAASAGDGAYLLDDLPSATWRVVAYGVTGYRRQYYPEADSPLEAGLLVLTGDEHLEGIDFSLLPGSFVDITGQSPDLTSGFGSAVYGLVWRDLDRDGDPDLFAAPASGRCRLLRNDVDAGMLFDDTLAAGAAVAGLKTAVSAADLDNNGFPEIHLPRYGPFGTTFPDALLQAPGAGGAYRDAAVDLGVTNPPEGIDSCWADFDGNGFADLFVVNLFQHDALYFNSGDGQFRERAAESGVTGEINESSGAAAPCDMDGDGLVDLLVVVDEFAGTQRHNHLYRNLGDGRFEDIAEPAGLGTIRRSLCAAWGDADNDGDADLFIGGVEYDTLLRNDGDGRFTDVTPGSGIPSPSTARGACWLDADLDGNLDLFILRPGDAGNRMLLGQGDLTFHNVSVDSGLETAGSWSAFAWADHDLDGDPDLALADSSGRLRLLRNDLATGRSWIAVDLDGRAAPRSGTGAVVRVDTGQGTITRRVGDLHAPRSRGDRRLLIGLGTAGGSVDLAIEWPSGTRQRVTDLPVNTMVSVTEAIPATWIVTGSGQVAVNPARIRCYLPAGREVSAARVVPFATRRHGVGVACADIDGDGSDEILAAPGPSVSYAPMVRAFAPLEGHLPGGTFFAFGHRGYGTVLAGGDVDNDGRDELAVAPGPGPSYGTVVAFYRYDGQAMQWNRWGPPPFLAYGPAIAGGTRLALGDLDGDGGAELVTAPGPLAVNGAHIRGWRVTGDGAEPLPWLNFLAYAAGVGYGAELACGDLDGDGRDELVTAPGPGPSNGGHLRVWRASGAGGTPALLAEALAAAASGYGARIACGDLDGDGRDELVTAAGPDGGATSRVQAWRLEGRELVRIDGAAFHGWQEIGGGAELAVGTFGRSVRCLVQRGGDVLVSPSRKQHQRQRRGAQ